MTSRIPVSLTVFVCISFLKRNFYKRCLLISANMNNLRKSLVISAAKGLSHPHWSISLGKHNYTRLPPTLFRMTVAMNEDSNVNFTLTVNVIRTGEKHGSVRRLERMECNGHWSLKKWNIFLFVKKMTRLRNKLEQHTKSKTKTNARNGVKWKCLPCGEIAYNLFRRQTKVDSSNRWVFRGDR